MSNRHAYLIMAHNQFELLKHLLKSLDYIHNDIYLHLDKKMPSVDVQELYNQVGKGKLYILPERIDVKWGDFSQIACEMYLLTEATKEKHAYYHLRSGVDFPLKKQKEIHQFFAQNNGVEYVQFETKEISEDVKKRISKYHVGNKKSNNKNFLEKIFYRLAVLLQFPVDRTKKSGVVFQKGANWFSITDNLARFVVSQRVFINRHFKYSICGDEMFLQTIVFNSSFRDAVCENNYCDNYDNILCYIDWDRGKPYEFTEADYDMLKQTNMLFARKFNWEKDSRIVLKLLHDVYDEE